MVPKSIEQVHDKLQEKRMLKSKDLIYSNLIGFRIRISTETFRIGTKLQNLLNEVK